MAEFDRIDLMNYLKYGNDYDEQWEEIRNYIKSNPAVQKELEEIRKLIPPSNPSYSKKRLEPSERNYRESSYERTHSSTPSESPPSNKQTTPTKKWWSKLLGEE